MRLNLTPPRHLKAFSVTAALVLLAAAAGAQAPYAANLTGGHPFTPILGMHDCNVPDNPVANCSFETGDFTDWLVTDLTLPFVPMQVNVGGLTPGFGFFVSAPTDGTFAMLNGFDGNGPGTIELAQDVTLVPGGSATLEFDYRGAWELTTFGATQNRTFEVQVQPAGGGAPLQSDLILTAVAGETVLDTGPLTATVDLSGFTGSSVRLALIWTVPELNTGPGFFQIDNVLVTVTPVVVDDPVVTIPTMTSVGIALLIALLIASSVTLLRKRRLTGS